MGGVGEGGGPSNVSRGVGVLQRAGEGAEHTREVRHRVSSVGRRWRVENSQAAVFGGDFTPAEEAGECCTQRSFVRRQEPCGGAGSSPTSQRTPTTPSLP